MDEQQKQQSSPPFTNKTRPPREAYSSAPPSHVPMDPSAPPPPQQKLQTPPPFPPAAKPISPPVPKPAPQSFSAPPQQTRQDNYKEPIRPQPAPFHASQKKALLNRGEVRTMQKDIGQLREQQARKERERIAQLKSQQETEKEREAVKKIRMAAEAVKGQEEASRKDQLQKIQDSILPPGEERRVQTLPKRPSSGRKIFVRIVVVVIFAFIALNLVLFAYWFFSRNQSLSFQVPFFSSEQDPSSVPAPTPEPPSPEPAPDPIPQPPPAEEPKPIPAPTPSIITPARTSTIQFSSAQNLSSSLTQLLETPQSQGFTQLRFRSKTDESLLTNAHNFFAAFGASSPAELINPLSQNTFFFSQATQRGNRFGMIVRLETQEDIAGLLSAWEPQMENDLTPLMPFWGEKGSSYTSSFRSSAHQGIEIRFQTFSSQDYGIVYALVDNYVILASSFEAAKAAIEALQTSASALPQPRVLASIASQESFKPPSSPSLRQALGQILMIGFPDASLTPELKDVMKRLQPGGVLLLSHNIQSIDQLKQLTHDLQEASLEYSNLPLFIAVDQEGGAISRIEFGRQKTAQSTIEDEEHAYTVGQERAEELKFLGVNLNLSPVLDRTSPTDFLFDRTFQAKRFESGKLAKALLSGQKEGGILSTLKHFPGYGNISFNPEKKLATVQEFPDISPFIFSLSANPEFLLLSNVVYSDFDPNNPFTFSEKGISLITNDMDFKGIIVSDDLAQASFLDNYSLPTIVEAPITAGVHMLMFSQESYANDAYKILEELAKDNPGIVKRIEDSAAKIIKIKSNFFFPSEAPQSLDHLSHNN